MKKIFRLPCIALLIAMILSGCGSLKSIHEYAAASTDGLNRFDNIGYSFTQTCLDQCRLNAIRHFSIQRDTSCRCALYETADSVTLLICNAISNYFGELAAFSGKDLTTYDLNTLQAALSAGEFGTLKITGDQAYAYMTLTHLLLHSTDIYRQKKIKQFIADSNAPLQILLKKLQFILQQNLENELNFKKESLYAYYKEMSLNSTLSDYEKGRVVKDYYDHLSDIRMKKTRIELTAKILYRMADESQQLYEHRENLNNKQIKQSINQYIGDINNLVAIFNHLK